ncbi:hypothetical protein [Vibrio spartinae]|uniref:Uncharacterized protein n=1 Tax=Vibrio spartinae TaxID=1918945 RepID=A0A1N6M3I3_9VIBR|nr:hypothetical protein [Vibrio spartinae]SIO93992.1 hypothetical protein VSP9026_01673 [Vibrio spartinae]
MTRFPIGGNTLAPGVIMTDFKDGAIRHSEQAQAMILGQRCSTTGLAGSPGRE